MEKVPKLNELCRARQIRNWAQTPLLVPAFSSVVDRRIGEIHASLGSQVNDASLVSAYDLYHGFIKPEQIWCSDIVFVDSGNFERSVRIESKEGLEWTSSKYLDFLSTLSPPLSKVVLVNYDSRHPLGQQVSEATGLFNTYPEMAGDFLIKPNSDSADVIDLKSLTSGIAELKDFHIIGLTEKELGGSILERCKNLVRLRQAFVEKEINIPIHIFGCLDPLNTLTYFLCGADIFDGLSWLRYGFMEEIAIQPNSYTILTKGWEKSDKIALLMLYVLNLKTLRELLRKMRKFLTNYDLQSLGLGESALREVKGLITAAGVELP